MANLSLDMSVVIFAVALSASFAVALLGRLHSKQIVSANLSEQRLNKWLIGLSAGATANSGFVVTAAVGLGYSFGAQWLLLPLSWLLGDVFFWFFFPQRINATGRAIGATTMTDVIVHGMKPRIKTLLKRCVAVLVLVCLGGYVAAQWLAGQKFLRGAFGFEGITSLLVFAALIVIYTAIGGFRGSVYVDSMQAIIRVIGTAIALGVVVLTALRSSDLFWQNIHAAGLDFLHILPHGSLAAAVPVIIGFAAASLGFGLGQPQMVTRYLAGADPEETQSAWPIYIAFVQGTWISMTIFGIMLRGIMPNLQDPEMGLSLFFRAKTGALLTGVISADIFATLAATSNSILVAMAQSASRDLLGLSNQRRRSAEELWGITAILGAITMVLSVSLHSSVYGLALSSVSLLGAGLAPAMLIRVLRWRHTETSLIVTVLVGFGTAGMWRFFGLSGTMNEAAPGMTAALLVNDVLTRFASKTSTVRGYVHAGKS
jgi:sodium/proline symporter